MLVLVFSGSKLAISYFSMSIASTNPSDLMQNVSRMFSSFRVVMSDFDSLSFDFAHFGLNYRTSILIEMRWLHEKRVCVCASVISTIPLAKCTEAVGWVVGVFSISKLLNNFCGAP